MARAHLWQGLIYGKALSMAMLSACCAHTELVHRSYRRQEYRRRFQLRTFVPVQRQLRHRDGIDPNHCQRVTGTLETLRISPVDTR